jgi:hypothetical protein
MKFREEWGDEWSRGKTNSELREGDMKAARERCEDLPSQNERATMKIL